MIKLFKPEEWSSNLETITFKSIKEMGNPAACNDSSTEAGKKKKKRNRKKKAGTKETAPGTQQAPKLVTNIADLNDTSSDDDNTVQRMPAISSGRVEKKAAGKRKQQLKKLTPEQLTAALAASDVVGPTSASAQPQSSLKDRLKEKLLGGRFRFINQLLYTMDSESAENLFQEDTEAFSAYHDGYRHQVQSWPVNPLDRIIKMICRLPKSLEIADFGCGDGKLAQSVPNKVYSLDLVSTRSDIIACDMANTSLQPQSIDVAVYCLSLMGTNLKEYLLEANRVLRMGGLVYIAEIQSRFDDERSFVRGLEACGFQLIKKDVSKKLFYFFEFKKTRNMGKVAIVPDFTLKPCLYRRR